MNAQNTQHTQSPKQKTWVSKESWYLSVRFWGLLRQLVQRQPGCVELASSREPQLFHFVTELQEGWVEFAGGKRKWIIASGSWHVVWRTSFSGGWYNRKAPGVHHGASGAPWSRGAVKCARGSLNLRKCSGRWRVDDLRLGLHALISMVPDSRSSHHCNTHLFYEFTVT